MDKNQLTEAVVAAENAVKHLPEGTLKSTAFQTVLQELLQRQRAVTYEPKAQKKTSSRSKATSAPATGTTARLMSLIEEGIFAQQRSLADIKQILAERGWHYSLVDLGTPLTRLVRKKSLRRTRGAESGKKTWRYSNY